MKDMQKIKWQSINYYYGYDYEDGEFSLYNSDIEIDDWDDTEYREYLKEVNGGGS